MPWGVIAQTVPAISQGCARLHVDIMTPNNQLFLSCPWTQHPAEVVSSVDHSRCNQGLAAEGQKEEAV